MKISELCTGHFVKILAPMQSNVAGSRQGRRRSKGLPSPGGEPACHECLFAPLLRFLLARCKHSKLNGFENAQLALQAFSKVDTIALPFIQCRRQSPSGRCAAS